MGLSSSGGLLQMYAWVLLYTFVAERSRTIKQPASHHPKCTPCLCEAAVAGQPALRATSGRGGGATLRRQVACTCTGFTCLLWCAPVRVCGRRKEPVQVLGREWTIKVRHAGCCRRWGGSRAQQSWEDGSSKGQWAPGVRMDRCRCSGPPGRGVHPPPCSCCVTICLSMLSGRAVWVVQAALQEQAAVVLQGEGEVGSRGQGCRHNSWCAAPALCHCLALPPRHGTAYAHAGGPLAPGSSAACCLLGAQCSLSPALPRPACSCCRTTGAASSPTSH